MKRSLHHCCNSGRRGRYDFSKHASALAVNDVAMKDFGEDNGGHSVTRSKAEILSKRVCVRKPLDGRCQQ